MVTEEKIKEAKEVNFISYDLCVHIIDLKSSDHQLCFKNKYVPSLKWVTALSRILANTYSMMCVPGIREDRGVIEY